MSRRFIVVTVIALLAIVLLAACGGAKKAPAATPLPTNTPVPPTNTPVPPTKTPTPSTSTSVTQPTATTAGEETLSEAEKALKAIDSYRVEYNISGQGTDQNGQKKSYQITMNQEIVNQPTPAMHLVLSSTEGDKPADTYEVIKIGNTAWLNIGQDEWIQTSVNLGDFMNSIVAMGSLPVDEQNSHKKGGAKMNGVPCTKYTFDEKDILKIAKSSDLGQLQKAKGEFCVAKDGGYPVHYKAHLEGQDLFGEGGQGSIDFLYDVLDLHKKFNIQPPSAEKSGGNIGGIAIKDFPKPEGAKVSVAMPHTLILSVPGTTTDVANFYRKALPKKGWSLVDDQPMGKLIMLSFKKGSNNLTVNVTPGENNTINVMVGDTQ